MKKENMIQNITPSARLLEQLVVIASALHKLPELSILEKVQLEQEYAIENLYYSSKLEGSDLTPKRIKQAIYGQKISAA